MNNMQGMMQQVQKLQAEMMREQQRLEESIFQGTDPQALVRVEMNGKYEVQAVKLDPVLLDPEDPDMVQDLLVGAFNQAVNSVRQATEESLGKYTQGLNLPF